MSARGESGAERVLRVVAAAIRRADGALLLSLRPAHTAHGGLWEFPGGKLQPRERPVDGLARELNEELGIAIEAATPLICVRHRYPNASVELQVFEVRAWRGEAHGREGQQIEWVAREALAERQFPAANLPVTSAVGLPRVVLVTPDLGADEAAFLARLEGCLAAGVELVQLRIRAEGQQLERVASAAHAACVRHGARLMLNGAPRVAEGLAMHGVHLNRARLFEFAQRPVAAEMLLSAACHDAAELAQAESLHADFVYLSPVSTTPSHVGAAPLGWSRLRTLTASAGVPVFALGGMRPQDLSRAARAGCQGVAMLSTLWQARTVESLMARAERALRRAAYHVRSR